MLAAILDMYGISNEKFAEVCVIVDKLDKIGPEDTIALLVKAEVSSDAATKIVQSLSLRSVAELQELTGDKGGEAVEELTQLFAVAEAYGFADWIMFDASVVRGLAYYTGIVFEGFDRKGELRAICGGGRYDKLLSLYGSPEVVPACGFGFGDCVVMELLRDRGLVPTLGPKIDFVVMAFNADMRPHAVKVAALLRTVRWLLARTRSHPTPPCAHPHSHLLTSSPSPILLNLWFHQPPTRTPQPSPPTRPRIRIRIPSPRQLHLHPSIIDLHSPIPMQSGYAIDVLLEPTGGGKKVAKAFSYADRVSGRRVMFLAPLEWESGKVRMKDLRTEVEEEKEIDLPFEGLVAALEARGITPMA